MIHVSDLLYDSDHQTMHGWQLYSNVVSWALHCHCSLPPTGISFLSYCCWFCHYYCSNAYRQCYCHCNSTKTTVLRNDSIGAHCLTHCAVSPQESGDGRYLHRCEVRIPFKKSQRGCIARHTLVASTGTLRFDMSRRALIWSPGRKVRTQHADLDDGFVVVVVNCDVIFEFDLVDVVAGSRVPRSRDVLYRCIPLPCQFGTPNHHCTHTTRTLLSTR